MFIEKKINEMGVKRDSRFFIYSIILNSIILALFIFLLPDSFKTNENQDYIYGNNPIALNIVNGESYNYFDASNCIGNCIDNIHFTHLERPPVFPILITLSYKLESLTNLDQYHLLIFIQYLLHLTSSLFIFLIYLIWFQKHRIALFASMLYSSYPLGLYLLKQPNSEVIFNFFLAFFVLLFTVAMKNKKNMNSYLIYFCGLILGLLYLTRFIAIFLPIFILFFLFFYYRDEIIKIASKMLLGGLLVVLPWQIYSSNLTEDQPKKSFGIGVFVNGLHWEQVSDKGRSKASELMSDDLLNFMEKTSEKWVLGDLSSRGEVVSYLINETLESPTTIIELIFWKAIRSLYAVDSKRYEMETFLINSIYFFSLLVLYLNRKKYLNNPEEKKFIVLSLIIFLYFYFLTISVVPIVRYSLSGILIIIPLISLISSNYRMVDKGI